MTDVNDHGRAGQMNYAVVGLVALLLVILAMFVLAGTVRLVALVGLSILFSAIFLVTVSSCPKAPGHFLMVLSTTLMSGVFSAILQGRGFSVAVACALGFSAPAAIAAVGAAAMTHGAKRNTGFGSGAGGPGALRRQVQAPANLMRDSWCAFLSRDIFKRAVFGLFTLLIAVMAFYGIIGVVALVSAAAIATLIAAIAAMVHENHLLRFSLILGILLIVISGSVFSAFLSRIGIPLFPASMLAFVVSEGVAWTLIAIVMRRRLGQWEDIDVPRLESTGRGADLRHGGAGHVDATKGAPRPVYASQPVRFGTIYIALFAIVVISIAMAFTLRWMAANESAISSSGAGQERLQMEAWLKEIVDKAPENMRKMREADERFRREVEAQRRRAGIEDGWQLSDRRSPRRSAHRGRNRSGEGAHWRKVAGDIRPGVRLYSGRGERKVFLGEVLEVISTDGALEGLVDASELRVRLKRPDGAVEEVTLNPADGLYVKRNVDG